MHREIPAVHTIGKEHKEQKISPFGRLFRLIGWWFGFAGLYATFAVCPFCGRQGCPVGIASAGTIGAFFTLCVQDWKRFFAFIKRRMKEKKNYINSSAKIPAVPQRKGSH